MPATRSGATDQAPIEGCRRIADLAQLTNAPKLDDDKAGRHARQPGLGQAWIELGHDATPRSGPRSRTTTVPRSATGERTASGPPTRSAWTAATASSRASRTQRPVQRHAHPVVQHRPDLVHRRRDVQPEHLRHEGIAQDRGLVRDVEDGAGGLFGEQRLDAGPSRLRLTVAANAGSSRTVADAQMDRLASTMSGRRATASTAARKVRTTGRV